LRLGDLLRKRARRNPLEEYFRHNPGRMIHKWHHYLEIYHRHLERFRGRSPVVLEIGVHHGGSLQMWREYFGKGARIVGVDVNPQCRVLEGESMTVLIGDQADRGFLAGLRERFPRMDILIDDGGHHMEQQIATFEELYPHLQPEGVYVCEDIHTSYMAEYGGGYLRQGSFVELAKGLIDRLHAWYTDGPEIDAFTHSTFGLHFYGTVMVAEKRPMQAPVQSKTGTPSI
jgi:cephalosporin hydroxylase